jgi:hypothetical protein
MGRLVYVRESRDLASIQEPSMGVALFILSKRSAYEGRNGAFTMSI